MGAEFTKLLELNFKDFFSFQELVQLDIQD